MKPNRPRRPRRRTQRRGVAIIMVIAFYAIAVTMIGVWVRSALGHQRQVRRWHEKTQATWLAEAGVRRAAARISKDSEFTGERWQIEAAELGGRFAAEVVIRIEHIGSLDRKDDPSREPTSQFRIIATARYPANPTDEQQRPANRQRRPANRQQRVQTTKAVVFTLPETTDRSGESS